MGGPRLELAYPGAAQQEAGIAIGVGPFPGGAGKLALQPDLFPAFVQPEPEAFPFAQNRFMRNLDRRAACGRIVIEGQQAISHKRIDNLVHHLRVGGDSHQFRAVNPPPGILRALAQRYQPQKHLPDRFVAVRIKFPVESFSPLRQRSDGAPHFLIGRVGEQPALPPFKQLRQGILQQRQRPGLVMHFLDDLRDQPILKRHADSVDRAGDGLFHLFSTQWQNGLHTAAYQVAKLRVAQRAIVKVGTQCDNHAYPGARFGHCRMEQVQEVNARALII